MTIVQWKIRAIRGATTVTANTIEAIREAVTELLEAIEIHNTPKLQSEMQHVYLQGAKNLRPDWQISPVTINR
jgi:chorismate mutase